jgi:Zn-dependent protease/CBS domain-containing protein
MRWSFKIARIAGIDVRIHATFFLLVAYVAYIGSASGSSGGLLGAIFICLLFLCVLLHEFGHAFAAKAYGIRTADITLLPIGGVARMERMPEKPYQELIVALAGPLVNVVIAAVLATVLALNGDLNLRSLLHGDSPNLLELLLYTNIAMCVFNLIPAFPLDGGRVLRSLLATQMDYPRATQIAATIGQGLALALGVFAAFQTNMLLILIAIFIYIGAENESVFVQMRNATSGLPVSSAMVTRFDTLNYRSTLDQAVDALLGTSQHEFPVLDDHGGFAGLLTKHDLLLALRKSGPETLVTDVMITGLPTVLPQMSFERAFGLIQQANAPALPVVDTAGRLVGLFTTENVGELLLVRSALGKKASKFGK